MEGTGKAEEVKNLGSRQGMSMKWDNLNQKCLNCSRRNASTAHNVQYPASIVVLLLQAGRCLKYSTCYSRVAHHFRKLLDQAAAFLPLLDICLCLCHTNYHTHCMPADCWVVCRLRQGQSFRTVNTKTKTCFRRSCTCRGC
jgi:hypothetical protein